MSTPRSITLAGLVAGAIGLSIAAQSTAADEVVSRGQLLASMCVTCHGPEGTGAKPNPSINGEDVADFVELMKAFASGEEPTSIMDRHAAGYTDEELQAIAEYFSEM